MPHASLLATHTSFVYKSLGFVDQTNSHPEGEGGCAKVEVENLICALYSETLIGIIKVQRPYAEQGSSTLLVPFLT